MRKMGDDTTRERPGDDDDSAASRSHENEETEHEKRARLKSVLGRRVVISKHKETAENG
jgi:hypothetical protein